MKPVIVFGIDASSFATHEQFEALPPRIELPQLDIMIHTKPRVEYSKLNGDDIYGKTSNFDLVLVERFNQEDASYQERCYASIEGEDLLALRYLDKHVQNGILERMFRNNPDLMKELRARKVRYFNKHFNMRSGEKNDASALNQIMDFGDTEWVVLKPSTGALGQMQIKMLTEIYYDYFNRNGAIDSIKNTEQVQFSPDWFLDMRNINNASYHARLEDLEVPIKEGDRDYGVDEYRNGEYVPKKTRIEKRATAIWPNKGFVVTEFVKDIVAEYRVIKAGSGFWLRERTRSDGDFPQTIKPYDINPHVKKVLSEEPRVEYRRCQNDIPLDIRMVKMANALATTVHQDLLTIDFFVTKDGELGIFEFGTHFGIDNTHPNFVTEVWKMYIQSAVIKWFHIKKAKGLNPNLNHRF